MNKFLFLFLAGCVLAKAETWPGNTPVVEQQPDGIISLNAEAAGFVMNDRLGRHLMNSTDPRLTISDGQITNLGQGDQYPEWRLQVKQPGKFLVYLMADNSAAEECQLRVSFYQEKRESRVVASIMKGAPETILMGEIGLTEGMYDAVVSLNFVTNRRHLPQIREIRLLPAAASASDDILNNPRVKSLLSKEEAVQNAERALRIATAEYDRARKNWDPKQDLSSFESYDQFVPRDKARESSLNGAERVAKLTADLRSVRIKALDKLAGQLSEEDRAALESWRKAQNDWSEQIARSCPKTIFPVPPHQEPAPLFPVGELEASKAPGVRVSAEDSEVIEEKPGVKAFTFDVPPAPDEQARREAFSKRNSPAGIEVLGRRLEAALRPNVPGLEKFYEACKAARYDQALNAYRDYFFLKLKSPEKYGADGLIFVEDFFQQNGKAGVIRPPRPAWVKKNMEGIAIYAEGNRLVEGRVGEPGGVYWAPAELQPPDGVFFERGPDSNPFWKTADGKELANKIDFFRALNRLPNNGANMAMFPDLIFSYCYTGNKAHLQRFADYLDDWTMNSVRDIDNCPVNIRAATELQVVGWFRALLRVTLDERPEFAQDFPAETLARLMMQMTETFHPYVVRAKRSELANWGIMGVSAALHDSLNFNEFRSMEYMNREMARLARIHWIQHLSLDGEGLEAWDEGHMAIDGLLKNADIPTRQGAPVMGDLEAITLHDNAKAAERALLTHFSPEGDYWVSWLPNEDHNRRTIRGKMIPRGQIEEIFDEPEARRRFFAALHGEPADRRMPLSDFEPYAQAAYLRDGFGADSTSLYFQNFSARSQTQGWGYNTKRGHIIGSMRTQFNVAREGRSVLEASPIVVDSKPPNYFVDLTPTGGKTDFAFQTPRNVQPGRFLSTPTFDVLEGRQDSPYSRTNLMFGKDMLGLAQQTPDDPIRGIEAIREIVFLRDEGIYIVGDRLNNTGGNHEFTQMYAVPLRVPGPEQVERLRLLAKANATLVDIDPKTSRVRSLSPGLPNVSLYLAGHDFSLGGRSQGGSGFEQVGSITAQALYDQVKSNKIPDRALVEAIPKIVSASWKGEGNQALASAVVTRPSQDDIEDVASGDLTDFRTQNGQGGIVGFSFHSAMGTEVWFQMAPTVPGNLIAGPGQASGGSLLVTCREGRLTGVVMDAASVTLNGKSFPGPSTAFAFALEKDGKFSAIPVRPAIDTTIISPQQTVFLDKATISFDIPTQKRSDIEFRYTLDGTDPAIGSTLYTGPFDITKDTLVKVRPFLKGLQETPWSVAGVEGGKMISAIFRKTTALPPAQVGSLKPGLTYQYFEDAWTILMSQSGMYPLLPVKAAGEASRLLDADQVAAMRKTDRAFGVKYEGFIEIPKTGIYRFFAPEPLYNTTMDAGYELRVWIDGQEWFPSPDLHAENTWSVALAAGPHRFQVSYVDFRWKKFRNEYWMSWNPKEMWQGTPTLEVDGPDLRKQRLPAEWLRHAKVN